MFPIDFCHIPVSIIKRSAGRSAVAAAAYRSGTKLTNEWDGMIHDYTRKGGIVHAEIMLPAHAPPEFADRSILWNSVEQIEKARDSQLAREIEAALPRELSGEQQLALVRAYVKDNFVDKGMCADFAIHDKGTGNPHVHIMLTLRPLKENGQWGAKCRKAYDLDENGQRIPDGKGGWKNHREDTTDWNDKGNVEIWRAAWAAYTNRALESAGRPERIDHRSYKRQGIDKIPSVHLGPAASQMEKRGIRTDKGEVNRQIAADNKLLKEIKARITRLYLWSKDEAEKPQTQQSSLTALWEAQQQLNAPHTRTGKIRALQESAALFSFLQANGIQSMQQLHEKITDMNSRYYDLRGKIVKAERRSGKGYRVLVYPCQVRRVSRHTFAYRKTAVQVSPYGGRLFICRTNRCVCRCGSASAPEHHPLCGRQAASPGEYDIPDGLPNRRTGHGRGFYPAAARPLPAMLRPAPAAQSSSHA